MRQRVEIGVTDTDDPTAADYDSTSRAVTDLYAYCDELAVGRGRDQEHIRLHCETIDELRAEVDKLGRFRDALPGEWNAITRVADRLHDELGIGGD
jgi:hypothetical protein